MRDDDRDGLLGAARTAVHTPQANAEERARNAFLDAQMILKFLCPLQQEVARRLQRKPAHQKMLRDYRRRCIPGSVGSELHGESVDNIARIRSRIVREIIKATERIAANESNPVRRAGLFRLIGLIRTSLRRERRKLQAAVAVGVPLAQASLTQGEFLEGLVGLFREAGLLVEDSPSPP
jgi:hypothetical protein